MTSEPHPLPILRDALRLMRAEGRVMWLAVEALEDAIDDLIEAGDFRHDLLCSHGSRSGWATDSTLVRWRLHGATIDRDGAVALLGEPRVAQIEERDGVRADAEAA